MGAKRLKITMTGAKCTGPGTMSILQDHETQQRLQPEQGYNKPASVHLIQPWRQIQPLIFIRTRTQLLEIDYKRFSFQETNQGRVIWFNVRDALHLPSRHIFVATLVT